MVSRMAKRNTQRQLAAELGVTPQHLNGVLKGRIQPSVKLAKAIAEATGIGWISFFNPDRRSGADRRKDDRRKS
jgi:transcriptional regulator with XRE-family HTH domain